MSNTPLDLLTTADRIATIRERLRWFRGCGMNGATHGDGGALWLLEQLDKKNDTTIL